MKKTTPIRESKIERHVCDYARNLGVEVYKFVSPGRAGVPDRMFIHMGKVWFCEFKAPTKNPTPLQNHEIELLRKQRMTVFVVDDEKEGLHMIDFMTNRYPIA